MIHRDPLPEDADPPPVPEHLFHPKPCRLTLDPNNPLKVLVRADNLPPDINLNVHVHQTILPAHPDHPPCPVVDGRYVIPGAATEQATASLRDRLYADRFIRSNPPPKEEILMRLGKAPVAANGNITGIQGQTKSGKTSVMAALIGAALRGNYSIPIIDRPGFGDCLGFEWGSPDDKGTVIHFDTEQSPADWHQMAIRAIMRSACPAGEKRLLSIPLVRYSMPERIQAVRITMEEEMSKSGIAMVVIDGLADLCKSPNDEEEALKLVNDILALCHEFNTAIACAIHENPGSKETGKTRGHLGSELSRKAFANLRVEKTNGSSVIYGEQMRKRDIPKDDGQAFKWSDEANMHVSVGTAGAVAAQAIEAKREDKKDKAQTAAAKVFGKSEAMRYTDLIDRIMKVETVEDTTAKNRIRQWAKDGILAKNDQGEYILK